MVYASDFETDDSDEGRRQYKSDFETDDETDDSDEGRPQCKSGKSRNSERRAFTMLSSVCSYWHLTLTGWPQSRTSQWVRHELKKLIERE